jgi:DNA-binding transcriptional LysR family regulator
MDIESARTFLKIVHTGSFVAAARSLHLTQAAISRRMKALEEYLGCRLLERSKSGVTLTPSGRRFVKYATNLVQTIERARSEVGVAPIYSGALTIGGRFGLWDRLLLTLLENMSTHHSDIQIKAEIGFEEGLMQSLIDGTLDIGVMYTPQHRPNLSVEKLLVEELILVSTNIFDNADLKPHMYVHVDWGPEFLSQLMITLPELSSPALTVGISWIGLKYILSAGGAGYFPRRLVRELIDQKRLFPVKNAPQFKLPAYVVYPKATNNELINSTVVLLKQLALAD